MTRPILRTQGLFKRFGGLVATDRLDIEVAPTELHAIIGPNGAGKTTLINQLVGEIAPDAGTIEFDGDDVTHLATHRRALLGLSRSYQITSIFPEFTALENVALAAQARDGHSFGIWQPTLRQERLTKPAADALEEVGLGARAALPASALAHGERRQLELAMALVSKPKLLLLDEPMAGMGRHESEMMVRLLASLKGRYAILLVEHDMDAVFALADRITVMVYGRQIASGPPEVIRASLEVKKAYLGERYAQR
ncbi:MAG TPA: ABC transporter ATP-binding protein [Bradyrhizobium sp.]|nr:ABC transporter ATP-binding protein [Bradyrhizobium sp.]